MAVDLYQQLTLRESYKAARLVLAESMVHARQALMKPITSTKCEVSGEQRTCGKENPRVKSLG